MCVTIYEVLLVTKTCTCTCVHIYLTYIFIHVYTCTCFLDILMRTCTCALYVLYIDIITHTHLPYISARPPSSEPVLETHVTTASKQSRPLVTLQGDQAMLQNLDRRVQSLEQQMRSVKQVVLQQNSWGTPERRGYGVWNALTFAGWLMVPLIVVFMFHYRKTAH